MAHFEVGEGADAAGPATDPGVLRELAERYPAIGEMVTAISHDEGDCA